MQGKKGNLHHSFIGRCSDHKGYWTVIRPDWYDSDARRIYEHHASWAKDRKISRVQIGYVIHHIDQDPGNNHPSNLVLLTNVFHIKLHAILRRCNDYPEREYSQVTGSAQALLKIEHEIVCSLR
jgi:hypothetical protein